MEETSGVLWLFINVILLVILGGALVYGIAMWSRRPKGPAAEQMRDQATRRVYEESERQKGDGRAPN
jgi:hypothetical protein